MADPDLWKRTVAHLALRRLATNAHKRILDLQELANDVEVERAARMLLVTSCRLVSYLARSNVSTAAPMHLKDLVAADLQIAALEELLKQSPSPERNVPMCAERRASNGRTAH